jgi:hypothetical protein
MRELQPLDIAQQFAIIGIYYVDLGCVREVEPARSGVEGDGIPPAFASQRIRFDEPVTRDRRAGRMRRLKEQEGQTYNPSPTQRFHADAPWHTEQRTRAVSFSRSVASDREFILICVEVPYSVGTRVTE